MRYSSTVLVSLVLVAVLVTTVANAKEGISATIHTSIAATVTEGSQIDVSWSLADEETGEPFSACSVFIRLIGPDGAQTEAFSECGTKEGKGDYDAVVVVPIGGISTIEIGVAGTMSDKDGNSTRSDWLIPLANDPLQN